LKLKKYVFVVIFLVLSFCGCKNSQLSDSSIIIHKVKPSETDISIDIANVAHYAGLSTTSSINKKLVVFLGGTSSDASGYAALLKTLINSGYHVISLNYPNNTSVGSLAQNDLIEYGNIRNEIVNGINTSSKISVSYSNSIINRLHKLLSYFELYRA